jgi:hypothetical protein
MILRSEIGNGARRQCDLPIDADGLRNLDGAEIEGNRCQVYSCQIERQSKASFPSIFEHRLHIAAASFAICSIANKDRQ